MIASALPARTEARGVRLREFMELSGDCLPKIGVSVNSKSISVDLKLDECCREMRASVD